MRLSLSLITVASAAFLWTGRAIAAPSADYSKEGFVIQQFSKHVVFAADGNWQIEQTASVRIQSDAGVQQFGVLSFPYNHDSQKIEIDYVRVRKPDASVVETPADNVQDISAEISRIAPMYSDLRAKQIPVKALGLGDVLEYKIRFSQFKPDIPGQFSFVYNFLTDAVVLSETLQIDVPAEKYVKLLSPRLKPEVHEEAGNKIYLWKTAQLEVSQKTEKPKTKPKTDSAAPSVQLTTFKSWEEVGDWYRSLQNERVAVTPAIQAKADELTKGLQTSVEKERAIYNFVSTKFRYISLSFGVGRYQPHAGEEVLANQYGDCKDKHTLLAALLKAAGIDAWPALIGTDRKLDEDFPSPAQFNHVITVVPEEKDRLWLDTTPEVAPFGLLTTVLRDRRALVIPTAGAPFLVTTPADPAFAASQLYSLEAALDSDGTLTGHAEFTTRGDLELVLRTLFHQIPPAKWSDLVEGMAQDGGLSGKTSKVDVDNPSALEKPFRYSYDYSQPKFSDWSNRRIAAPLMPLLTAPGDDDEAPAEPFFLGAPGEMVYRATIRLPEKYSAELPPTVSAKADFAEYSGTYSLSSGVLKVERRLLIKKAKIPVDAWAEYRKFAKTVAGDHDGFIQIHAGAMTSGQSVPNNSEAEKLLLQAFEAGQRHDENAMRDYLARAERLNPKQRNLWATYGALYFSHQEMQKGLEAVEKEIQFHPENINAYRLLSYAQISMKNRDAAISTFRNLLKQAPGDVDASTSLARLLLATKQYSEIPDLLQPFWPKAIMSRLKA